MMMRKSSTGLLIAVVLLAMITGAIAQPYYGEEKYKGIIVGTVVTQTYYKENYEKDSWKSGGSWSSGGTNDAGQNTKSSNSYTEGESCWGSGVSEQGSEQNTETTEKENYREGVDYRETRKESWTESEKAGNMEQHSNSEQYAEERHKEDYSEENYWKARENYWKARQEYLNSKNKYGAIENEVVFQNAKDYLSCGCLLVENWLGKLRTFIETSNLSEDEKGKLTAELDTHISSFEEYRNSIANARTPDEIKEITQRLKNSWLEARAEARSLAGKAVCFKLNKVMQKAEHVEIRLESRIALLNQSGYDTTELEAILKEYSQNLNMADENLNLALNLYDSGTWDDCSEAELYIKNATNCIKMAFNTIREFLTEFKSMQAYNQFFYENESEVWVYSNYGNIIMKGSGVANARVSGAISITPSSAVVSASGFANKSVKSCSRGQIVNFEGDVKTIIRGENVTIEINGTDIRFFAKGNGTVLIDGNGIYRVKKPLTTNMTDEIKFSGRTLIDMDSVQWR